MDNSDDNNTPTLNGSYISAKAPCVDSLIAQGAKIQSRLNPSFLKIKCKTGEGNFGVVYKGRYLNTIVAVKETKDLKELAFLLSHLPSHPHIITIMGVCPFENGFRIVMEWMQGGDLLNFLQSPSTKLSYQQKLKCCIQVALGLEYLHSYGIMHRDLAARNCVLVWSDTNRIWIKLTDFGLSRTGEVYNANSQMPIAWTSPEGLETGTFTVKSDIWSMGVVFWEILSQGKPPYQELGPKLPELILDKLKQNLRLSKPADTCDEMNTIMGNCWKSKPLERPTCGEILKSLKKLEKFDKVNIMWCFSWNINPKNNLKTAVVGALKGWGSVFSQPVTSERAVFHFVVDQESKYTWIGVAQRAAVEQSQSFPGWAGNSADTYLFGSHSSLASVCVGNNGTYPVRSNAMPFTTGSILRLEVDVTKQTMKLFVNKEFSLVEKIKIEKGYHVVCSIIGQEESASVTLLDL